MKSVIVKSKWMMLLGRPACIKHILGKLDVKVSTGLKLLTTDPNGRLL